MSTLLLQTMNSFESDRYVYFNPQDPLGSIDHDYVSSLLFDGVCGFDSMNEAIASEKEVQIECDKEFYDTLEQLSRFIVSNDVDYTSEKILNQQLYVGGMTLALSTVDTICDSIAVDRKEFRGVWVERGLVELGNVHSEVFKDRTITEKQQAFEDSIIRGGQAFLSTMNPRYAETISELSSRYNALSSSCIFESSYGFILGSAMQVFADMFRNQEAARLIEGADMEQGIQYLLENKVPVDIPGVDTLSDELDTELFYSGKYTDSEQFIGRTIEQFLSSDAETIEMLNSIARALYPDERGFDHHDEECEAFFLGSVFALEYVHRICTEIETPMECVSVRWKKDRIHTYAHRNEVPDEDKFEFIDSQVIKTVRSVEFGERTEHLLDKVVQELGYDFDEQISFNNGFAYTLASYKKAIKGMINSNISALVKAASQTLDADIARLYVGTRD